MLPVSPTFVDSTQQFTFGDIELDSIFIIHLAAQKVYLLFHLLCARYCKRNMNESELNEVWDNDAVLLFRLTIPKEGSLIRISMSKGD